MDQHQTAVDKIAERVKLFYQQQCPFRIYHGSTNSTRQSQYSADNIIDTSTLTHVLEIDVQSQTALVEPNVPMDNLIFALLPHGLMAPVITEFPGITVGGAFAGTAGESSSARHGFFDENVLSLEMVLASGEIVQVDDKSYSDLFKAAASSLGTLAVTTLLKLKLVEAKPYVALTYFPLSQSAESSLADSISGKTKDLLADTSFDYIDGIVFSKSTAVLCAGRLASDTQVFGSHPVQTFRDRRDPWFYLHAQQRCSASGGIAFTEYVPLVEYLFRYDRGGFWVGKFAFDYFYAPFDPLSRSILNRFLDTRSLYHALHKSQYGSRFVIQDVGIPTGALNELFEWTEANFQNYPLWLCPLRTSRASPFSPDCLTHGDSRKYIQNSNIDPYSFVMNVGIWGPAPNKNEFVSLNKALEDKVYELGGKKWLYARCYYDEQSFWQMYDEKAYRDLRRKYGAEHLPDVYDKVCSRQTQAATPGYWERIKSWILWNIWPIAGLYGLLDIILGHDYLLSGSRKEAVVSEKVKKTS